MSGRSVEFRSSLCVLNLVVLREMPMAMSLPMMSVRVMHPLAAGEAHEDVLQEPEVVLLAHGLALGAGEVPEAHGELPVALAQLVRAGVSAGSLGFSRNWK